jgi:ATP-binding cassette, subfamily B, multidrug efflux pump
MSAQSGSQSKPNIKSDLKISWAKRFWEESSITREYLYKYRKLVCIGLCALLLVDILEILPPIFLKQAVDTVMAGGPVRQLRNIALFYVGVGFIQGFGRYGWRMYLIRSGVLAGRDLRSKYSHHIFGLSMSFFDRRRIGDLMSLATSDVESVQQFLGSGILTFVDSLIYFATVPVAMYFLSPKLMLLAFVPLPIIPFLVMRNEREIHVRYEKVQEQFSKLSAMVQESLNGIRVTKAFAKEDVQSRRIRDAGEDFVNKSLYLARVQTAFGPTLDFTMSMGLVLLLYVGGGSLVNDPTHAVTLGTFVAFQRYIQKMVWPMAALGMSLSMYQRSVTSSDRLKEVFGQKTDVPDADQKALPQASPNTVAATSVSGGVPRSQGRVEFRNLSFSFPGHSHCVLSGINLTVEAGERIAFIGTIGAGKSALLSLLPRLYPVERGMLFVDGIDVNDWPLGELRKNVGYVSQDVFLFSESVMENVAYGLHEWASGKSVAGPPVLSVEEATQLASVHQDVLGLTGSYKTRLGERGVNLSGGQKQRLTIARALAKKPPILVLDDALSSVDVHTEEKILRGLADRPGRNTEIIAAHRISTVQDSDRIVVLDGGFVRQVGKHAELMEDRRGAYRRFYEQQQLQAKLKDELESYAEKLDGALV